MLNKKLEKVKASLPGGSKPNNTKQWNSLDYFYQVRDSVKKKENKYIPMNSMTRFIRRKD